MKDKSEEYLKERIDSKPIIYAYSLPTVPDLKGYIKIGQTTKDANKRIKEQLHTPGLDKSYKLLGTWPAMRSDGSVFKDFDVRNYLTENGFKELKWSNDGTDDYEWIKCNKENVGAAVIAVRDHKENELTRDQDFKMRDEQAKAVKMTKDFFEREDKTDSLKSQRFLWNAKMRFGKTFTAYELAKEMNFKRILILTFKPAVKSAWREDLLTHVDFEGWQFIANGASLDGAKIDEQYERADKNKPIVCFGSFQDFMKRDGRTGNIKAKNEWVHTINWDLVIFDEYHYGAWRDNAKQLFEFDEDVYEIDDSNYDAGKDLGYDEGWLPITANHYLYLSGTPFRALATGEFGEDQIYNWTYSDEQNAKENWKDSDGPNPYASLPRMVMLTYELPEDIKSVAKNGENNEFDLNVFFSTEGDGENAKFKYEDYVQKWLDFIRGYKLETFENGLKLGADKIPLPYEDTNLLSILNHTLWFLPNVASCWAMKNLLEKKNNTFFHDYHINVCAGAKAGIGEKALKPVRDSMEDPLVSKSITLSCSKLTTGVTIKPWTGIFMLRNLQRPETYFQAAFRVQSPWEITNDYGEKEIIKENCYVFDFAPNRALKQVAQYSRELNPTERNQEKSVAEFTRFLPIFTSDGTQMKQVNAADILDIALSGTSASMLAKRWQSALLVNVDNITLERLMNNEQAMNALMKIEEFRSLNSDIETVISKSEIIKKAKKDWDNLSQDDKKKEREEEKEYKSMRKKIQEKLIKLATRIPVFMYLTDYREYTLDDVITKIEPALFKKVTGLTVEDYNLLLDLNVFNKPLMNDAVFNFKRYEDPSLEYTGINKHSDDTHVGGFDTVLTTEEYESPSFDPGIKQ